MCRIVDTAMTRIRITKGTIRKTRLYDAKDMLEVHHNKVHIGNLYLHHPHHLRVIGYFSCWIPDIYKVTSSFCILLKSISTSRLSHLLWAPTVSHLNTIIALLQKLGDLWYGKVIECILDHVYQINRIRESYIIYLQRPRYLSCIHAPSPEHVLRNII